MKKLGALVAFFLAATLAVSAAVVLVVVALARAGSSLNGYDWPDETAVASDAEPHPVSAPAGDVVLVWTFDIFDEPRCTVADAATGAPVALRPTESRRRPGGTVGGDYVATREFTSPGTAAITCTSRSGSIDVYVEPAPRLPGMLDDFGMPLALGGASLLLTVVASGALVVRTAS